MTDDPRTPTPAQLARAREIAHEDGGAEEWWTENHSCGALRYGCCGGGKDIDRDVLASAIARALADEAQRVERERDAAEDQCADHQRGENAALNRVAELERQLAAAEQRGRQQGDIAVIGAGTPPAGETPQGEAQRKLASWVPCDNNSKEHPFFSEAYLYPRMGKEDARTLLALARKAGWLRATPDRSEG